MNDTEQQDYIEILEEMHTPSPRKQPEQSEQIFASKKESPNPFEQAKKGHATKSAHRKRYEQQPQKVEFDDSKQHDESVNLNASKQQKQTEELQVNETRVGSMDTNKKLEESN